MAEQIRNRYKKSYIFYGLNLFLCILSMGSFVFSQHFSVDDYWIYFAQSQAGLEVIEQSWRVFVGVLWRMFDAIGFNIIAHQKLVGVILILAFAWVITKISFEIAEALQLQEDIETLLLVNMGTLILFLNAGLSEHLYYTNAYTQWILASLGMAIGTICISRNKKIGINWLVGVGALTIVAGSYQTFLAQYAYIAMAIIFIQNKGRISSKSITACIRAMAAAISAMIIDILIAKTLVNFRGGGKTADCILSGESWQSS